MGCVSSKPEDPWQLAQLGATGTLTQWLVNGGSPNAVDKLKGRGSLLHCASAADHVDCIKLLVRNKADVNIQTDDHGTPLHSAASAGASNAVTQLLAYGACTTVLFRGQTAGEVAQRSGYPAIAHFIQMNHGKPGADPDSRTTNASSAGSVAPLPDAPGPAPPAASLAGAQPRAQRHLDAQQRLLAEGQRHMEKLQALQVRERLAQARRQMQAAEAGGAQGGMPRTTSDPSEMTAGRLRPDGPRPSISMPAARGPPTLGLHPRPGCGAQPLQPLQPAPVLPSRGQQEKQPVAEPPLGQQNGGAMERRRPRVPASAGGEAAPSPRAAKPASEAAQSPRAVLRAGDAPDPSTPAAAGSDHAATTTLDRQLTGLDPATASELGSGGSSSGPDGSVRGQGGAADALAAVQQAQQAQQHPRSLHPGRPDLARIPSGELAGDEQPENGASSSNSGSNSRNSSANSSLLDDPLLKFLKQALNRQPSGLSQQSPGRAPCPSPFASLAAAPGGGRGGDAAGAPAGAGPQQLPSAGPSGGSCRLQSPAGSGEAPQRGRTLSGTLSSGLVSAGSISIDIRPWQIDFEDLHLQKKTIGEGSFGKVYVAKWHETLVAVKVLLDLEEAAQQQSAEAAWTLSNPILHNLQKECALMASLRHPNVVQFMGVSPMPPAMISEYCARGSLNDVLRICNQSRSKASQMTWLRRLTMALDATKGMLYLHRRGIIHRDLKSPNLLVESTWRVKVADFNLSKIVEDTSSGRSTIANMNPRWLAPEILNGDPATTASDVFSWGVVMWELLTFQCPWPHTSPWALVGKLMDGHRLAIPPRDQLPGPDTARFAGLDAYIALMQRCWAQEPEDRPDFEEVIRELRKLLESQARMAPGGSG